MKNNNHKPLTPEQLKEEILDILPCVVITVSRVFKLTIFEAEEYLKDLYQEGKVYKAGSIWFRK